MQKDTISDHKKEVYFGWFLNQKDNGDFFFFSSQEEKKQEQKS